MNPVILHILAQIGVASAGAGIAAAAGADYSSLGVWAGAIQGVTALLATIYNNYFGAQKKA